MTSTNRNDRPSPNPPADAAELAPGLYIVATPIGNLGDMSRRAVEILSQVGVIACEDTRVTGKLLSAYGISTPMTAYHDHNAARVRPALLRRLQAGEPIALVADAGTPLISDPGHKLVRDAVAGEVAIFPVPGANAALAALVASGLPAERFTYLGFLPSRRSARRKAIDDVATLATTLVLYESPRRLAACLADLADILGDRDAVVARELTKRHEEIRRADLARLAGHYAQAGPPKGEVVLVVAPPDTAPDTALKGGPSEAAIRQLLDLAVAGLSTRDAADLVATATGAKRRDIYRMAIDLKGTGSAAPGDREGTS